MTTKSARYEHNDKQITLTLKDKILYVSILDHLGCSSYGNEFTDHSFSFSDVLPIESIYELLNEFYNNHDSEICVEYTNKTVSMLLEMTYVIKFVKSPIKISLELVQTSSASKDEYDKMALNKRIYKLEDSCKKYEDKISKLEKLCEMYKDDIFRLHDKFMHSPSISFNNDGILFPRSMISLYLGEMSVQYHETENFIDDSAITPIVMTRPIYLGFGFSLSHNEKLHVRSENGASNGFYFRGGSQRNDLYSLRSDSSLPKIMHPYWDLKNIHNLHQIKYLAIDCLAISEESHKLYIDKLDIPETLEHLYLIDPKFTTIPDIRHLNNLKKITIDLKINQVVKAGMRNITKFKIKHPEFEFVIIPETIKIDD